MIFVLAFHQATQLDTDLWWHFAAGELIVTTNTVPHTDSFSFTKNGAEWVAHEWLSEVVIYGIYRYAGRVVLVLVFSLMIAGTMWMVYRRCEGRPYAGAVGMLLAAGASAPLFGVRPQMITLLLASIYITLLERFSREERTRVLLWLPPLMLLWVNLHAGFALGLALVGLYVVAAVIDGSRQLIGPLVIALMICTAMVPLNPNGFRMFSYPYETLTSSAMASLIEEWASPDFHQLMYLPLVLLLLGTPALLALSPKRVRSGELFLFLVTAFAALRSIRHIPIFALIAAPIFANHLWEILKSRGWGKSLTDSPVASTNGKLAFNLLFLIVFIGLASFRVWHFAAHPRMYEEIRNPVAAVDFMLSERPPGPIYNRYGWGGYLIYRLYPAYRVFIDGRADVYGDQFFADTVKTYNGVGDWASSLDRYGINTVLISPDVPLANLLRNNRDEWKVLYEDPHAIIFARTSPI